MDHCPRVDEGRDEESGNPHAGGFKGGVRVPGGWIGAEREWRDMIVKSAVFIVGDEQERLAPPLWVRGQRLINRAQEGLAARDRRRGMIIVRRVMRPVRVFRLNEDDGREGRIRVHIPREVLIAPEAGVEPEQIDGQLVQNHRLPLRHQGEERQHPVMVDPPWNAPGRQPVIDEILVSEEEGGIAVPRRGAAHRHEPIRLRPGR